MSLFSALSTLLTTLLLHFRLFLLRTTLFFRQTVIHRTRPRFDHTRTALIIGDANALGFGDTPIHLGLSTRLPALLRDPTESLRTNFFWHVLTAGKFRSRAAHWVPGSVEGLFEKTFVSGPFRSAVVVLILLGSHDDLDGDGLAVVEDIARVAEGVARLGKQAVVASMPNAHPVKSEANDRVRAANESLRRRLEVIKRASKDEQGGVAFDVDLEKVFAMGNHTLQSEQGYVGLNANGYRLLAREAYEPFVLAVKRVEYAHFKNRVQGMASHGASTEVVQG